MLLKTNKHLPFTFLLLVGVLLGYTSCRRNLETSNQGRHTPTTNSQGQHIAQTSSQAPPTATTNNQGQDIVQASSQSQPTVTTSNQGSPTPIEEALPDALIDGLTPSVLFAPQLVASLKEHLRELKKNPATIDKIVPYNRYSTAGTADTVLQIATKYNKLEVVQALLETGADPNAKNSKTGRTALYYAAGFGHLEVVKALIAKKAHINQTDNDGNMPLRSAAIHGKVDVVQALLEAGAEPNAKNSKTGLTALHEAAAYGHLEVIEALIDARADINQTDNDGNTPLHTAVSLTLPWCQTPEELEAEIEEVVKLLTEQPQINLNLKNNSGETALDIATSEFFPYKKSIPDILKQCAAK